MHACAPGACAANDCLVYRSIDHLLDATPVAFCRFSCLTSAHLAGHLHRVWHADHGRLVCRGSSHCASPFSDCSYECFITSGCTVHLLPAYVVVLDGRMGCQHRAGDSLWVEIQPW